MPFHQYGGSTPNVSRYWICAAGLGITYSIAPPGFPSSGRARRPETPVQSVITPRVTNSRLFTSGSPRLARGSPTSPDPSASTSDHRSGSPRPRHGTRSRRRPRLPRPNQPLQWPRLPLWRRPGDIISCRRDFRDLLDGDASHRDGHPRRISGSSRNDLNGVKSRLVISLLNQHREDADLASVHVVQLRRYEAGGSQPTLDALKRLALALSVSTDMLVFDPAERDPGDDLRLHFEALARLGPDERKLVKTLIEFDRPHPRCPPQRRRNSPRRDERLNPHSHPPSAYVRHLSSIPASPGRPPGGVGIQRMSPLSNSAWPNASQISSRTAQGSSNDSRCS